MGPRSLLQSRYEVKECRNYRVILARKERKKEKIQSSNHKYLLKKYNLK